MTIPEIKARLTLARVLHHYGLKPDKNLRLHCPFHDDTMPSLQVYYKTHTAYCFSSNCKTHGKSMDVIDFVMHMENTGKHPALLKCVQLIGTGEGNDTAVPSQANTAESGPPSIQPLLVSREQFLGNLFMYFRNAVHASKPAREYIRQRGLDYRKIEIGYNTGQFHHGTRKDEHLIRQCLQVGLLAEHDRRSRTGEISYKPFGKYCIVFALRNETGQITGLYFRSTVNNQQQQAAATSAARHFYLKDSTGLYPGYPSPDTRKLIIAESIIDAASLLQLKAVTGQYNLLSAYGTNRLTDEMKTAITALNQLTEIIFAFDNDEAGNKAAAKYKEELQALLPHVTFTKLILPCKDVNETLTAHTPEVFAILLNERTADFSLSYAPAVPEQVKGARDEPVKRATPVRETKPAVTVTGPAATLDTSHPYKLRYSTATANYFVQGSLPRTTDHLKIMLVIEHLEHQQKSRNRVDLYEDRQVEKLVQEVSERLHLRKDLLAADLYRLTDLLEAHIEASLRPLRRDEPVTAALTLKETAELKSFAGKPKLIKRLNELLGGTGIVGEERNRIFLLLIAISHKMPETLHALIQGSSGSGKTRLLKQISDCIPRENVTKLTRLSDKVLYNFPENYFVNRLLCLEDIDGLSEEAEFGVRELQSNGELNSATSMKRENGQISSGQKTVKGPIATLACTTHGEIYEDNMSRVFLIAVDESTEQTKRIIAYQNDLAAGTINREEEEKTKRFLQKFISILQPYKVVNPYAHELQLPEEAHKIRRLNELLQSFVKMVTIINQYQRKVDEANRLITAIEDIETAVAVLFESIVLKVDELDGSLRQFYERLKQYIQKQYGKHYRTAEFSLREIRQALSVSKTQVFRYASDLVQLEYLRQSGGHANRGFTYKVGYWDNYQTLRERIKLALDEQVKSLKTGYAADSGTPQNASGTLEPAPTA